MPALLATYEGELDITKLKVDFDYSGKDFVQEVTTREPKTFGPGGKKRVVLIDYGVKMGIVRELVAMGCEVVVVPGSASAAQVTL